MIRRYYHLIWAAGFSGGLMLCRVDGIYCWFSSWGYVFLTVIIAASLIANLIFLLVLRSPEDSSCNVNQHNDRARLLIRQSNCNSKHNYDWQTEQIQQNIKFLNLVLCLYGLIFILLGMFCGARLQVYNFNRLDEKIKIVLENNGDTTIVLNGRISSHPKISRGSSNFTVDTAVIYIIDNRSQENITLEDAGEVSVALRNYYGNGLERDELVSLRGNYREGQYSGYILAYSNGFKKLKAIPPGNWLFVFRKAVYKCISNTIYSSLDYRQAAICEAAVLGNSANINESQAKDFINSGIYHLLAISGLHISFFIIIAKAFSKGLIKGISVNRPGTKIKNYLSIVLVLAILLLYNFIIGQKASVLRATVMSVFVIFSSNWGKAIDKKTVLSFTYLILLVMDPIFFIDSSFWLSFLSVAAIIYLNDIITGLFYYLKNKITHIIRPVTVAPCLEDIPNKKPGYFISIFITSLSVNLFIFPVIMYLFGRTGIFAIILNIAAIPLFYAVLFVLLISALVAIIWPPAGALLLKPVSVPLYLLMKVSKAWKISGASVLRIDEFGPIYVILYYIALCSLAFALSWFQKKQELHIQG